MYVGRQNSGTSLPGSAVEGELFWKSDTNQLFVYNGGAWILIKDARGNYFGNGSDGAFTTSGNTQWTVPNRRARSGNLGADGDMVVKQFTTMNIQSGHTVYNDYGSRGMLILCTGNCTIAGKLNMSATGITHVAGSGGDSFESRGGVYANPANKTGSGSHPDQWPTWGGGSNPGSDNNIVGANGLEFAMLSSGATGNGVSANEDGLLGCGTAARGVVSNFPQSPTGMKVFRISRVGAAGASGVGLTVPSAGRAGANFALQTSGSVYTVGTGGGGSGGTSSGTNSNSGNGGAGTCWSGGSGGTGVHTGTISATGHGSNYGGHGGGYHDNGATYGGDGGGAGNPGGHGSTWSYDPDDGTAGIIILIVGGTFSGNGQINAVGGRSGNWKQNTTSGGGGTGGGAVLVAPVTNSFTGTIDCNGGAANGCAGGGGTTRCGGAGGNGSYTIQTVAAAV